MTNTTNNAAATYTLSTVQERAWFHGNQHEMDTLVVQLRAAASVRGTLIVYTAAGRLLTKIAAR